MTDEKNHERQWEKWKDIEALRRDDRYDMIIARGSLEDCEKSIGVKFNNLERLEIRPHGFSDVVIGGSRFGKDDLRKAIEVSSYDLMEGRNITIPVRYSDRRDHPILIMQEEQCIAVCPLWTNYGKLQHDWTYSHFFEQVKA